MSLKNVFDRMFLKHLSNNFFKHFRYNVYKLFHDECLKNISSLTFSYFINVLNVCSQPSFLSFIINV